MKLIDLLKQEVPKRGGWPDGAAGVVQDTDDMEFYFFNGSDPKFDGKAWWFTDDNPKNEWIYHDYENEAADDNATAIITREQYEVWIPPVGTECEVRESDSNSPFFKWQSCTISAINIKPCGENQICVIDDNGDFAIFYPTNNSVKFRPIRTEREKGIEAMLDLLNAGTQLSLADAIEQLYDAGYRKV